MYRGQVEPKAIGVGDNGVRGQAGVKEYGGRGAAPAHRDQRGEAVFDDQPTWVDPDSTCTRRLLLLGRGGDLDEAGVYVVDETGDEYAGR